MLQVFTLRIPTRRIPLQLILRLMLLLLLRLLLQCVMAAGRRPRLLLAWNVPRECMMPSLMAHKPRPEPCPT